MDGAWPRSHVHSPSCFSFLSSFTTLQLKAQLRAQPLQKVKTRGSMPRKPITLQRGLSRVSRYNVCEKGNRKSVHNGLGLWLFSPPPIFLTEYQLLWELTSRKDASQTTFASAVVFHDTDPWLYVIGESWPIPDPGKQPQKQPSLFVTKLNKTYRRSCLERSIQCSTSSAWSKELGCFARRSNCHRSEHLFRVWVRSQRLCCSESVHDKRSRGGSPASQRC